MRKTPLILALLASALTLPLTALADTIDDFVITGNGETVTFSLPATGAYTLHEHFDSFTADAPGTINGTPVALAATFYVQYFESVPQAPALGISSTPLTNFPADLYGSIPYSWYEVPAPFPSPVDEGTVYFTFDPGTYQLQTTGLFTPSAPTLDFTLTITPETNSPVPEPSTIALLATGALGLISAAKRRACQTLN